VEEDLGSSIELMYSERNRTKDVTFTCLHIAHRRKDKRPRKDIKIVWVRKL
jgi:hypothetical protein